MKECITCNQILDKSNFELRSDTEKLRGQCKECCKKQKKKYTKKNKEKLQEKRKKWENKNKDKLQDYQKNYRKENRENFREYSKKWRDSNKEKEKERWKKHSEENRKLKCQICKKEFTENDVLCQDNGLLMYHLNCYECSIKKHNDIIIYCSRCRKYLSKSKFDTYQKRNELRSWCTKCWEKINKNYEDEKWKKPTETYIKYDYTVLFHNSPTLCDDFDWLYDQRVNKKKSIMKIAESANCTYKVALTALKKADLNKYYPDRKTRDIKPKNHVELSHEAINFINGLLLSDGSITCRSTLSARIIHTSKHKVYAEFIKKKLNLFGVKGNIIKSKRYDKRYKKINISYTYTSLSYNCFLDIYNKWYLNDSYFCPYCNYIISKNKVNLCEKNGQPKCFECGHELERKTIPKDIMITRITFLHWYLGDGYFSSKKHYYIGLCTDGFLDKDIKLLQKKLNQSLTINSTYGNSKRRRIFIHKKKDIKKSFIYLGECKFTCFKYKFPKNLNSLEYKNKNFEKIKVDLNKVKKLRKTGLSWNKIAKQLNISNATLYRRRIKYNIL